MMSSMGTATKTLYDTDFVEWSAHTAQLVRAGRLDEVDLENLAEEIEGLGKRDRWAVHAQLRRLLLHQIKRRIQPEREGASWRRSILNSQERITSSVKDSPSLKPFFEKDLRGIYTRAVRAAFLETGVKTANLPEICPFTMDQLLEDFDLDWPPSPA
ncbi:MAG: DUF29 domain-containing protein [Bryobacterales bacterium]|nr:DUF29 domain-containing protein [Bryobacterales bacterium]